MVNLIISGLPKNLIPAKFLNFLKKVVFGSDIALKMEKTIILQDSLTTLVLAMQRHNARQACRFLNGYLYKCSGLEFPLQCWIEDTRVARRGSPPRKELYSAGPIDQSRVLEVELHKIDFQIEQVRKQRMLLEDANSLLFEKKKTEMLQQKRKPIETHTVITDEMVSNGNQVTLAFIPNPTAKRKTILQDCYNIIRLQMHGLMIEYVKDEDRDKFVPMIGLVIKKRLLAIVGHQRKQHSEILSSYRELYPLVTDRKLVRDISEKVNRGEFNYDEDADAAINEEFNDNETEDNNESVGTNEAAGNNESVGTNETAGNNEPMYITYLYAHKTRSINVTVSTNETRSINETVGTDETRSINLTVSTNETRTVNETVGTDETQSVNETVGTNETSSVDETVSSNETRSINGTVGTNETRSVNETVSPNETRSINETVGTNETRSINDTRSVNETVNPNETRSVNETVSTNETRSINKTVSTNEIVEWDADAAEANNE